MEENIQMRDEDGGKSFAELLEESGMDQEWLKPGQRVEAVIVKVTPEWVFIDVGGKHEGYLDRREFLDAEENVTVKEGGTIRAYFLSSRNNEKLFTTKVSSGEASRTFLADAAHSGIPVEGLVEKEIKGGFEVRVAGDVRAFCPFSQMDLRRVERPTDFVGQRLEFVITELSEDGRNVILSRRVILEEELAMGQRFHNAYEETKYQAELLVRRAQSELPATVLRPSIVVGDSRTGEIDRFDGPYALAILHKDHPDLIVCARKESPLIVGIGREENFIASDVTAILHHTRDVVYLDNLQGASIRRARPGGRAEESGRAHPGAWRGPRARQPSAPPGPRCSTRAPRPGKTPPR